VTEGPVIGRVVCVRCGESLNTRAASMACARCGQQFPRVGGLPVLLPDPDAHVALWRRQLALLLGSGTQTQAALEEEARSPALPAAGRTRLEAMARGVRDQVADFAAVMGPALGGPLEGAASGLPRGVVEYSYYLFRDWGWRGPEARENAQAIDALAEVIDGDGRAGSGTLGRVLVVGAGGCRLAYDLHRRWALETAVLDIDPYLFVVAEAVVRGGSVRLTEAGLNVHEASRASAAWTLTAPAGPLGPDAFHFFLANGLAPPFLDGTFDTVVTPWFIDRVPTDLGAFIAALRRLLAPGGRWLNQGPLLYPPTTPVASRWSREEIFAAAAEGGFRVDRWAWASRPYLVSPLTGAGKIERTLTFAATSLPP
jgi:carnosine N-methyltransferase